MSPPASLRPSVAGQAQRYSCRDPSAPSYQKASGRVSGGPQTRQPGQVWEWLDFSGLELKVTQAWVNLSGTGMQTHKAKSRFLSFYCISWATSGIARHPETAVTGLDRTRPDRACGHGSWANVLGRKR